MSALVVHSTHELHQLKKALPHHRGIARAEGVHEKVVRVAIERGLRRLE